MSKTRKPFIAVLIAGALLAGACSDGGSEEASKNPKKAFTDALEALTQYEGITVVLSIEADAADLASDELPAEAAQQLVDSSFTVSAKSGETPEDAQAEFTVNVGGNEDAIELKALNQSLYARVEVRELVEAFGGSAAEIDTAVQQASAAGLDFAQPLADGEWVGVEGLDQLVEQFTGVAPTSDPEQAAALADRLTAIFEDNADVASEGSDDVGDHLVVRVPLKETVEEAFAAVQELGGTPAGALPPLEGLDEIPAGAEMPVDVWISDGALVQVEVDFVKFAAELGEEPPEGVEDVAMRMTIEEFTDDVEAPADYTAIDLQEILGGILGAGGTMIPTEESIEIPAEREVVLPELGLACSDLQTLSPEEIQTFLDASGAPGAMQKIRKACPELF